MTEFVIESQIGLTDQEKQDFWNSAIAQLTVWYQTYGKVMPNDTFWQYVEGILDTLENLDKWNRLKENQIRELLSKAYDTMKNVGFNKQIESE